MGLAERADVIVDFTNVPVGNYVLGNVGPDEPFGGGVPGVDFPVADPDTTGQMHAVPRRAASGPDLTTPPQFLVLPADRAASGRDGHSSVGAARGSVDVLRRRAG